MLTSRICMGIFRMLPWMDVHPILHLLSKKAHDHKPSNIPSLLININLIHPPLLLLYTLQFSVALSHTHTLELHYIILFSCFSLMTYLSIFSGYDAFLPADMHNQSIPHCFEWNATSIPCNAQSASISYSHYVILLAPKNPNCCEIWIRLGHLC